MSQQRRWKTPAFAGVVLISVFILAGQLSGLLTAGAADTKGLVGQQLIDSLGVEPVTSFPVKGCKYGAEANGQFYCLDGEVSSSTELRLLAIRMRGREPTTQDRQLIELIAQIDALDAQSGMVADQRFDELSRQIRGLISLGAKAG